MLKYEMCGVVRPIKSSQCVTVDSDRKLSLTAQCEHDTKIFCFNSTSEFIKLRGNDEKCVTGEKNKALQLEPCEGGNNNKAFKWDYWNNLRIVWRVKTGSNNSYCWKQDSSDAIIVGTDCEKQQFDFQMIKETGTV